MTAPEPHPSHVLRPPTPTITLRHPDTDAPVEARLRARMDNLALIEERYGSLGEFIDAFGSLAAADDAATPDAAMHQQMFRPVIGALACLMPPGEFRQPSVLGLWLVPDDFMEYVSALSTVLSTSLAGLTDKAAAQPAGDGPGNAPTTGTAASTGAPSTTPPPSSSDGPTPSSGG